MMSRTRWSHTMDLPADALSASRARDFVGGHLNEHVLSHLAGDARLAVSELATNALVHAQTPFTVILEALGPSVVVTVKDGSTSTPRLVDAEAAEIDGRGILIVQTVSHGWGVLLDGEGGKSVWAWFETDGARD